MCGAMAAAKARIALHTNGWTQYTSGMNTTRLLHRNTACTERGKARVVLQLLPPSAMNGAASGVSLAACLFAGYSSSSSSKDSGKAIITQTAAKVAVAAYSSLLAGCLTPWCFLPWPPQLLALTLRHCLSTAYRTSSWKSSCWPPVLTCTSRW